LLAPPGLGLVRLIFMVVVVLAGARALDRVKGSVGGWGSEVGNPRAQFVLGVPKKRKRAGDLGEIAKHL
jgi:hypothetical protein